METRALTTRPATTPELTYRDMLGFAGEMLKTGFLPKAVDTPAKAVAIILTGREMGVGTMQALRGIWIVQGRPTVAADLQLGIFKRAGGHAAFRELSDEKAVLWLQHPNGDEHVETYSMTDAKAAGLTVKETWKAYPRAMLRSRAITAGLKSIGFEACSGVYDPEEVEPVEVEASVTTVDAPPDNGRWTPAGTEAVREVAAGPVTPEAVAMSNGWVEEEQKRKAAATAANTPEAKEKRHLWALVRELGLAVTKEHEDDGTEVTLVLFPPETLLAIGWSGQNEVAVRPKLFTAKERRAAIASLEEIRGKVGAA